MYVKMSKNHKKEFESNYFGMFTKCIFHTNFNVAVANEFHLIIILMKKVVKIKVKF